MKKLTAVEWLVEESNLLENNGWLLPLIEIAKGLEKDQIIDAYKQGFINGITDYSDTEWGRESTVFSADEYYTQTYKQT